jgi:hypothetical protein
LQEVLECRDLGVLECRSIGVLKEVINPSAIALSKPYDLRAGGQHSSAPKLVEISSFTMDYLLWGYKTVKLLANANEPALNIED